MAITYTPIEQLPRLESVTASDLLPVSHEGGAAAVPASGSGIPYDETSFLHGLICGYHSAGWY